MTNSGTSMAGNEFRHDRKNEMSIFFEYRATDHQPFDPAAVVAACIENDRHALLLECDNLPKEFFDLSSGVTGALVHRLTMYGIRMAVVLPDASRHSLPFQDFVREANRGRQFHFAPTRESAVAWLEKKQ